MIPDPTDEIRAIRRTLAARCGNDLHRIVEETRRRQRESGRDFVTLSTPAPALPTTTIHPEQRSGAGDRDSEE